MVNPPGLGEAPGRRFLLLIRSVKPIEPLKPSDPAESDPNDTVQSLRVAETICTIREVIAVVNRPQDIEMRKP